ncbi:LPS translocon maturation chaperone LptM [Pseudoalteromonas luteoviolacea]|uniref:LPS translocon maturation chaperone LptM n=1 Tax=Pseudoalteromonas luteoviolacea TaxID=43657 RepID=UPI001FFD4F3E|nr:lipoprotein [Pseudoalteromonas luteoviolacea]
MANSLITAMYDLTFPQLGNKFRPQKLLFSRILLLCDYKGTDIINLMKATYTQISLLALVLTSSLTLSACGQRGPLYLPEDADKNRTSQPQPEAQDKAKTDEKE